MNRKITFSLLLLIVSIEVVAQVKKTGPTKTSTPVSKAVVGMLKPEDYKYYLLVNRGSYYKDASSQTYYTLKDPDLNYGQTSVILDVRDMKEVAYWPSNARTYLSEDNQQLFALTGESGIYSFSNTGSLQNYTQLSGSSYPSLGIPGYFKLKLSKDFKKVAYAFNKDIWIANFDRKTGNITNPKQVTFFAPSEAPIYIYFDDKNMLIGQSYSFGSQPYLFNLQTGKYRITGGPANLAQFGDIYSISTGYVSISNQETTTIGDDSYILTFLNKENTKAYIRSKDYDGIDKIITIKDGKIIESYPIQWKWRPYGGSQEPLILPSFYTSPNGNKLANPSHNDYNLSIFDISSLKEQILPLKIRVFGSSDKSIKWIDEQRFLFNAEIGNEINGQNITEETQGTYWFDTSTLQSKRLTPYFLDVQTKNVREFSTFYAGTVSILAAYSFTDADKVIFQANNYLYSCKLDGSDVKQLTKFPNIYKLDKKFIDDKLPLLHRPAH